MVVGLVENLHFAKIIPKNFDALPKNSPILS